jgi:hypothetical protein
MRLALLVLLPALVAPAVAQDDPAADSAEPPRPPQGIRAADHPWDDGTQIDVFVQLSPDDAPGSDPRPVTHYVIRRAGEHGGEYVDVGLAVPAEDDYERGELTFTVEKAVPGEPYFFRAAAVGPQGAESDFVETAEPVRPDREWFAGASFWLGLITLLISAAVVGFILLARRGIPLRIRKIAGLEAVDEAVGRATEMGRPCLFVPGVQDINDIQTVAGLTVLSRVSRTAAEYDAKIEVPTARSLVMTTAREAVQSSYLAAGRPDAYHEDNIYYVTDEQFGYVAYLSGHMVREKPAACFYMGSFFAESLILAETGNSIGAIQVAGTAQPAQLPFFVAACDYTLIGEEFFAASAYLSGDPDQLGSLKGQDVGKVLVAVLLLIGCALVTLASPALVGGDLAEWFETAGTYLRDEVLRAG